MLFPDAMPPVRPKIVIDKGRAPLAATIVRADVRVNARAVARGRRVGYARRVATFRAKLDRLGALGPGGKPEPAPEARVVPDEPAVVAKPARTTEAAPAPSPSLDELRDRIASILAKSGAPAARAKPADLAPSELPFASEPGPLGPLWVRRRTLSAAHRVGLAGVRAVGSASAPMLAMLALDPALADRDPMTALFVDTETTGLSGGTGTVPFLVGVAYFSDEGRGPLVVEQMLLRQLGEEAPILARLAELVSRASMLVSFNGKSFDLPLLRTRFVMCRVPAPVEPPHLDLVHVARRLHRARIGACDLKAVETHVLGFEREGDIPSGEVVSRYSHYLRTGDDAALDAVVVHNEWDVVAMAALLGLYGEPLESLGARDLAAVARTLKRAKELELADAVADRAVARGGGHDAVRARAEIAKARGDKARAMAAFESVLAEVDDADVRLELAKLYEHHAKQPLLALDLVARGTGERPDAAAKRAARLRAKASRGA